MKTAVLRLHILVMRSHIMSVKLLVRVIEDVITDFVLKNVKRYHGYFEFKVSYIGASHWEP